jgi:hypothetical protein
MNKHNWDLYKHNWDLDVSKIIDIKSRMKTHKH